VVDLGRPERLPISLTLISLSGTKNSSNSRRTPCQQRRGVLRTRTARDSSLAVCDEHSMFAERIIRSRPRGGGRSKMPCPGRSSWCPTSTTWSSNGWASMSTGTCQRVTADTGRWLAAVRTMDVHDRRGQHGAGPEGGRRAVQRRVGTSLAARPRVCLERTAMVILACRATSVPWSTSAQVGRRFRARGGAQVSPRRSRAHRSRVCALADAAQTLAPGLWTVRRSGCTIRSTSALDPPSDIPDIGEFLVKR